ncbi:MAG: UDP-N-acetylmuramoyl-L-alanyl-D-glutamate--2,6-diaminopimelate ligase [Halopseudomonas sp.]
MSAAYQMTLQTLLPASNMPPGIAAQTITGISNDSRRIQGGDLFLACRGEHHDGTRCIDSAVAQGAVAVVCENGSGIADPGVPLIELAGLNQCQAQLASRFYQQPSLSMQMIGITGTNGKTSCSHFVAQALTQLGQKTALIGTTGNGFVGALQSATHTTPDAVRLQQLLAQLRDQAAQVVAMEVSSHALEQQRVAEVAFDQAVFTNLSRDHLDYHGSMEAYAEAKARLFLETGISQAVINTDDDFGRTLWSRLPQGVEAIAIGARPLDGAKQLRIVNSKLNQHGIQAEIDSPWGALVVNSPLLGQFNLYNLLTALAVLVNSGVEPQQALASLNRLTGVEGRMQVFTVPGQPLVVVDYAHTPDALDKALASLRQHCDGQLWCLFGCGGDRDRGKRPLMAQAAAQRADRLVVTSDNPRSEDPETIIDEVMDGLTQNCEVLRQVDRRQAIEDTINQAAAGDIVLVAGKGHEDYQEIMGVRHPFSDIQIVRQCLGVTDAH